MQTETGAKPFTFEEELEEGDWVGLEFGGLII